jgi:membrane protein YqaA with SNARE-associated domain
MSILLSVVAAAPSGAFWKWIYRLGGPGLILLGLLDNAPFISAPPGVMDICTILLAAHHPEWWAYYALMATVGEVIGGYLTYRLAEKGGKETLERRLGKQRAEAVYKRFAKFESMMVLVGAILPPPFPFSPVVMTAGVLQYPHKKFLPALAAGRGARYFALAFLGRIYGRQMMRFFSRHYRLFLYIIIGMVVAGAVGALVFFLWKRRRNKGTKRRRR